MQDQNKQRIEDTAVAQLRAGITAHRTRHQHAEDQAEEQAEQPVDFDGGARTTAPGPARMDDIIRRAAGYPAA